jgi:hypothetical protein
MSSPQQWTKCSVGILCTLFSQRGVLCLTPKVVSFDKSATNYDVHSNIGNLNYLQYKQFQLGSAMVYFYSVFVELNLEFHTLHDNSKFWGQIEK